MQRLVWLGLLFICGCSLWVPVGGPYVSSEHAYEVDLPANWRRASSTRDGLTMTRDGVTLQVVRIARDPFDKELPFTKRKLDKGMLPQEAAEVVIDNFRSNRDISNFQVSENQPALVGGYPGFKISYSFQTKGNLRKQGVYYGVLVDQWFYRLFFEAPARHYFPKDQPALERMKETFKIKL